MRTITLNEQVTYKTERNTNSGTSTPTSFSHNTFNDMITRSESNRSVSQPAASPTNSHPGRWAGDERERRVGRECESPVEASAVLHNVEHVHHRRVFGDNHLLEVLHFPRHRLRFLLSLRRLRTCWALLMLLPKHTHFNTGMARVGDTAHVEFCTGFF